MDHALCGEKKEGHAWVQTKDDKQQSKAQDAGRLSFEGQIFPPPDVAQISYKH